MFGSTWTALLSSLLVASSLGPLGALGSVQHSSIPLDKRDSVDPAAPCWTQFASDPQNCPVLGVAFFKDHKCLEPYKLTRTTPRAHIRGNAQLLFDGAVGHSLKSAFGSIRVVAAVPGVGLGFGKQEESDTVVQNMAWMSPEEVMRALKGKECITFPNLDASQVGVWSAKSDSNFNQPGYVWNPDNIPIKKGVSQCQRRNKRSRTSKGPIALGSRAICLESASYGGGGVLELYTTDNCTPDPKNPNSVKRQLYSTVQCTALNTSEFKSIKAVQPLGPNVNPIFSPIIYDFNQDLYHTCAQKDVNEVPFKPGQCQKMNNQNVFVGVYGNDPGTTQPGPSPGDRILRQGSGGLLLSPAPPAHHPAPVHKPAPGNLP